MEIQLDPASRNIDRESPIKNDNFNRKRSLKSCIFLHIPNSAVFSYESSAYLLLHAGKHFLVAA